jgi:hypothetical protein
VRGFAVQQQRTSPVAERAFVVAPEQSGGTTLRLTGKEERGDVRLRQRRSGCPWKVQHALVVVSGSNISSIVELVLVLEGGGKI